MMYSSTYTQQPILRIHINNHTFFTPLEIEPLTKFCGDYRYRI